MYSVYRLRVYSVYRFRVYSYTGSDCIQVQVTSRDGAGVVLNRPYCKEINLCLGKPNYDLLLEN